MTPPKTRAPTGFRGVELLLAAAGAALLLAAWRMDAPWFDRHVLVPFYYVRTRALPVIVRLAVAAAGAAVLLLARPLGAPVRALLRLDGAGWARVGLALLAALAASEGIVRVVRPPDNVARDRPLHLQAARLDDRLGWRALPSHTTVLRAGGRPFAYVVNAFGDRVRAETDAPDPARPTLVVTGESIAVGFGLDYDDTFAALVGRDLGVQVVNVAESGYGPDQAYLRLLEALPRVPRPAAVVAVFVPSQVGRLTRQDRPRLLLDARGELALVPTPGGLLARSYLHDLVVNHFPYVGDDALARATASASAALRAISAAAAARGARPLFVIPSLGPPRAFDERPEAPMLRTLFVDPGLDHVIVDLDQPLVIPGDGHPNSEGAKRLARAIEAALRSRGPAARVNNL